MSEPTEMLPRVHLTHSPTVGAIAAALAKAQSVTKSAPKDHTAEVLMKSGGKYTYSYADLAGVWDAGREPLGSNGLALVQAPTLNRGGLAMTTLLMHSSGEWIRGELEDFPVPDRSPQGVGTSITYARRYTVGAMVGIVSEEDDDGGNGGKPKAKAPRSEPRDERPAPTTGAPTTLPNYGPANGAPISGAKPEHLQVYLDGARKNLADSEKAKWHARDSALIGAIEAEMRRQTPATAPLTFQNPPADDATKQQSAGVFYAQLVKACHDAGQPDATWKEWLKGNGITAKTQVTEAHLASFKAKLAEMASEPGSGG